MIEFRTLETFVWVAQLRSFRGAAAKLNTTQPSISQRVAQLEDQLGVRLLERGRRTFALTEAGRSVLAQAERLLRLAGGARRLGDRSLATARHIAPRRGRDHRPHLAAALRRGDVGALRTHHAGDRGRYLAEPARAAARPADRPRLPARADQRAADPVAPAAQRADPLLRQPEARLRAGPVPLARIAAFPIITFARNTQPYMRLRELLADPHLPPTRIHASAALATAVRMALDGLGVALIPASIVAEDVKAGRLVEVGCPAVIPDPAVCCRVARDTGCSSDCTRPGNRKRRRVDHRTP